VLRGEEEEVFNGRNCGSSPQKDRGGRMLESSGELCKRRWVRRLPGYNDSEREGGKGEVENVTMSLTMRRLDAQGWA